MLQLPSPVLVMLMLLLDEMTDAHDPVLASMYMSQGDGDMQLELKLDWSLSMTVTA